MSLLDKDFLVPTEDNFLYLRNNDFSFPTWYTFGMEGEAKSRRKFTSSFILNLVYKYKHG